MQLRYVLLIGALFVLMMWSSAMSFNDELQEEADYITNVCDGIWPDFKGLRPTCPDRFAYQP
jgi:hypothetical protein